MSEPLTPRKVLVIGVGQIGSDLVPTLLERGDDVVMMDLRPPEDSASLPLLEGRLGPLEGWRHRWLTGDVTDPNMAARIEELAPDVVFLMAAVLSATGEKYPDLAWRVNIGGTLAVMDGLRALQLRDGRARTLILPSSIAAYGPLPDEAGGKAPYPDPTPNEYPLQPTTMYGISKVTGELLGEYYTQRGWLDYRGVRFPGLLNATPPGGGTTDYANLMYFAGAAALSGEDAEVTAFVEARTRLPFMYMPDAVRGLMELADAPAERLTRRTYNIAAMSPSAADIAAAIQQHAPGLSVRYVPDHRQQIADSWPPSIDDAAARRDWGWQAEYDLEAMTAALLAELRG